MTYINKTQPTTIDPKDYLEKNFADNESVQKQSLILIDLFTKATGTRCVMWNKLFGFGKFYYKDSTGGEHNYFMTGFAISSTGFTIYGSWEKYKKDIQNLGKYKLTGKSCLAIKKLEDIDLKVLQAVIKREFSDMKKNYKVEV